MCLHSLLKDGLYPIILTTNWFTLSKIHYVVYNMCALVCICVVDNNIDTSLVPLAMNDATISNIYDNISSH